MSDIRLRQMQHADQGEQDDPHRIGRGLAQEDRFGNSRASFQGAGRDNQQGVEHQKRRQILQPDGKRRFAERAGNGLRQTERCNRDERRRNEPRQ